MEAINELYQSALWYIARGWSAIPLTQRDKTPWPNFALAQYQRQRKASTDEIYHWWKSSPDANVGICTGKISGLFVVDCDSPQAYERVQTEGYLETLVSQTGKGYQIFFEYPNFPVSNRAKPVRDYLGIQEMDIRGDGGYVVAAPSVHPNGAIYKWLVPEATQLAPAPGWLLDLLRPPALEQPPTPPVSTASTEKAITIRGKVINNPTIYAAAAANREIDRVRDSSNGSRNENLNSAAFNLGELVVLGLLDRPAIEHDLLTAALTAGMSEQEARATLRSGFEAGTGNGRQMSYAPPTTKSAASKPKTPPASKEERRNLTDLGNAKRLVKRWGNRIKFVGAFKKWFIWDGTRWQLDETGAIMRAAKETVLHMYTLAPTIQEQTAREKWIGHTMHSESRGSLEAMIGLAASERHVVTKAESLDANNWLLNCRNVTIDLFNMTVSEHNPDDLITKRIDVTYDKKAKCPTWEKFINRIMAADAELIEFVQRAVGYSLTGEVSEQCLFFMFGTGRNGKSTFVETLLTMLGEYSAKTPTETLMARDRTGIPNDVARLAGKRLVVARETDENQRLAEATIKDLTGGDKISARFLHQEFFEFKPAFKIWMYGNHKPLIRGVDEGIWRRIRLIPFTVSIPAEERDPYLPLKLERELSGILNWALQGVEKWLNAGGLGDPIAVRAATAEYRSEMDVMAEYISDNCGTLSGDKVTAKVLYTDFSSWCEEMGERAMSQRQFGLKLKERGFQPLKTTGGLRSWIGISVNSKNP